jgi:hypothetical protein
MLCLWLLKLFARFVLWIFMHLPSPILFVGFIIYNDYL